MTNRDQIDAFVAQAKARLDEMGAAAKSLEMQIGEIEARMRPEAEQTLSRIKGWMSECEAKLTELGEKGELRFAGVQSELTKIWSEFDSDVGRWVEVANSQRTAFDAQAQLASWQGMVDGFMQKVSQTQEAGKAAAEAELERLQREAENAKTRLEAMQSAGEASWEIMSKGLEDTRASFEKAALQAWTEFNAATKK